MIVVEVFRLYGKRQRMLTCFADIHRHSPIDRIIGSKTWRDCETADCLDYIRIGPEYISLKLRLD